MLRVQDGTVARQYPVTELIDAIGLAELRVAKDAHFGSGRVFAGFALESLLSHVGLEDAQELLLVCTDGCRIAFDTSVLSQQSLRGLLAVRDAALPDDGKANWLPYRHGAETVNFDPFYLVWGGTNDGTAVATETLPWPFQLTEIQRFDRESYFAPARPPAGPDTTSSVGAGG